MIAAVTASCVVRLWWTVFVVLWGTLAFAALVAVYYASTAPIGWQLTTSADRVVFSLALGLATLARVLAAHAWERTLDDRRCEPDAQ